MGRCTRIAIGLNSGTSVDGVDAVACEITGRGPAMRVRVIGHLARRYPIALRRRILDAMAPAETRTEEICRLETEVGRAFARSALAAVKRFDLKLVDFIGMHGQTICHLPPRMGGMAKRPRGHAETGTMQIGDAAIVSTTLGVPVTSRFRQADMAVGGQGAPLVPWTDHVLFHDQRRDRVIQNIGGIANLTWLPAGGSVEDVIAVDTGPGNMLIDGLVSHFTKGKEMFDRNGRRARRGRVRAELLDHFLDHPFLSEPPPRSCGREEFGEAYLGSILAKFKGKRIPVDDWIATATRFTATSIAGACALFLGAARRGYPPMDEMILCGGGAKNKALVDELKSAVTFDGHFGGVRFSTTADYGIPIQAKECVSFAMLGAACLDRVPANLPRVTGAERRVILGQVCNP